MSVQKSLWKPSIGQTIKFTNSNGNIFGKLISIAIRNHIKVLQKYVKLGSYLGLTGRVH